MILGPVITSWVWFSIKYVGRSIFHISNGCFSLLAADFSYVLVVVVTWYDEKYAHLNKERYLNWAIYWFWLIDHKNTILQKFNTKYENDTNKNCWWQWCKNAMYSNVFLCWTLSCSFLHQWNDFNFCLNAIIMHARGTFKLHCVASFNFLSVKTVRENIWNQ